MASNRAELAALRNMIAETDQILATIPPLPGKRNLESLGPSDVGAFHFRGNNG
jgi:hypothetical protein